MVLINNLKNADVQNLFLDLAYGTVIAEGDLCKTLKTDDGGVYVQHKLGRGEWDGVQSLYWRGFAIHSADYQFHPGTLSTGNSDTIQGVDSIFSMDIPHSLTAWMRALLPNSEVGSVDISTTTLEGLVGIYRTRKVNDYDSSGNVTGYGFSANPARIVADLHIVIGKRDPARINWVKWCAWRDYCDTSESVDYTTLPNFTGFGLTGSYYNGSNFDTFLKTQVDAIIEFDTSAGAPTYGQNTDNFSVRWEGKIKPRFSESYTFTLQHDDGVKLFINDLSTPIISQWVDGAATHTATISLTADTFYDIKIEWYDHTGNAQILLQWQSASQVLETVPPEVFYPKAKTAKKWEVNVFWSTPTRLDDAIRKVLDLSNSWFQRVDGKYEFFCYEQLTTSSFTFDESANYYPDSFEVIPRDPTNTRNVFQCAFHDLDSPYLDQLPSSARPTPMMVERPDLIAAAGQRINGDNFDFANMTRWQAYKLLNIKAQREADSPDSITFTGNAETYSVLAGDRVKINIESTNTTNLECWVVESTDKSSETTADDRDFVLKELIS